MPPFKPKSSSGGRPARRDPSATPRREGGDRPSFRSDDRGPRREGGERQERRFEGGDRPQRRFDNDRPSFRSDDRGPRREGGERQERGPRSDRPQRDFSDRAPRGDFDRAAQRSGPAPEGEQPGRRGSIRTYRAPASLKGKAAPIKVIRPEDTPPEGAEPRFRQRKPRTE